MAREVSGFGAYLKEIRTKLGWSLRDVQARTGGRIHNAYLSQIESGKVGSPAVETVVLLAETYGVDLWTLFHAAGWTPGRPPDPTDRIPAALIEDLTSDELDELIAYAGFIRARRQRRSGKA